ncbi:phage terminase small subunit [Sphingomonas phyllosphaerae]|uniref:phage terminase small subunit n=1 Tax=Sphingomonas phyllosphaerae TaxID=257003 RepID=UPI0009DBE605|nr:phage terminase small subunit [Sphingomonas phyllosphaerae]
MSLARRHREYIQSLTAASAPAMESGLAPAAASDAAAGHAPIPAGGISTAAHTINLRMQVDLRRLKDIKSVANKIAVKQVMIGEYRAWCDGLLEAGRNAERGPLAPTGADEVLPTIMVWAIDIGFWAYALELAEHVLRHDVALPARYKRDPATLIVEQIAEAALNAQSAGNAFPIDVLEQVEALVDGIDMHDEVRAKLLKAIGTEVARGVDAASTDDARRLATAAIERLAAAQALHDRVGVKTQIRGLEKVLAALPAPTPARPLQELERAVDALQSATDTAGDKPAD